WLFKQNEDLNAMRQKLLDGTVSRGLSDYVTVDEEAVIRFYTTNAGYKTLNQALRGQAPMTDFLSAYARTLSKALNKLPASSYSSLFRMEYLTEEQIAAIYTEGGIYAPQGFTSTT